MGGNALTQERLKQLIHYEPLTGLFYWRVDRGYRFTAGQSPGYITAKSYRRIKIDGKPYYAHRLAWLYMYGEWPDQVDHINGDRLDNRIANLRNVSLIENLHAHRKVRKDSRTGVLGVTPWGSRYVARLKRFGKVVHESLHTTIEEASAAYQQARKSWAETH